MRFLRRPKLALDIVRASESLGNHFSRNRPQVVNVVVDGRLKLWQQGPYFGVGFGGGHLEAQCLYTILETGTGHRSQEKEGRSCAGVGYGPLFFAFWVSPF